MLKGSLALEGRGLLIAACLACVACQQQRQVLPEGTQQRPVLAEGTYRAFKMLQGATAVGVTKPRYDELLQRISGELAILASLAVDSSDTVTLRRYTEALQKHKVAGTLWSEKIENVGETTSMWRYGSIPTNHFVIRTEGEALRILRHYGLTPRRLNEYWTSMPETSISALWQQASTDIAAADALVVPLLRAAKVKN